MQTPAPIKEYVPASQETHCGVGGFLQHSTPPREVPILTTLADSLKASKPDSLVQVPTFLSPSAFVNTPQSKFSCVILKSAEDLPQPMMSL